MIVAYALLLFSIFSCWAADENIVQQAANLFITNKKIVTEGNPILQQAPNQQPSLYMKTAKKIVLDALKFDPMMTPKNIRQVEYTPSYMLQSPFTTNVVKPTLSCAQIETVWPSKQKQPDIFLFYKDVGQQLFVGEAPLQQSIYSFKGKFYTPPLGTLDMSISPNGKYVAVLTNIGFLEIRIMDEHRKDHKEVGGTSLLKKLSVNPELKPTSGAIRWLNNGKGGYCVCGTELYEFSFDSSILEAAPWPLAKRVGQFTTADPQSVIIKNLSVESKVSELALSSPSNSCVIDYTQEGRENAFIYSSAPEQPEIYTIKTNLGNRSLILSSPDNLKTYIKVENLVTGIDIATTRNFKNLEKYNAVAVDEDHNTIYLFKDENQNKTNKSGFVPVLEQVNFVPDYINDLVRDFNQSVVVLTGEQATGKTSSIRPLYVWEEAENIVKKALIIYQKAWDKNMLLGPIITPTQGAVAPQTPAPQPQGNFFQRLYGRASTWYTSLTNATKTRMRWFAGVMAAGAGAVGLTWLYSKSNKGSIPAAYSKIPQLNQPKLQ